MATSYQLNMEYIEHISKEVIYEFGGSYQTYDSLKHTWRKEMDYRTDIEDFIMLKTRLFVNTKNVTVHHNFNVMYLTCDYISKYLAPYLVKKAPRLSTKQVAEDVLNSLFLKSPNFVERFKKKYKKPIDIEKPGYAPANPGIVAMYKAINNLEK